MIGLIHRGAQIWKNVPGKMNLGLKTKIMLFLTKIKSKCDQPSILKKWRIKNKIQILPAHFITIVVGSKYAKSSGVSRVFAESE